MLLVLPAWGCDAVMLATLPIPSDPSETPAVERAAGTDRGVGMAGARVTFRSAHPLSDWGFVLDRPEAQDEWMPARFGTRRAERLDADTLYQQLDITLLFGALTIRRQIVAGIRWLERGPAVIRNCWSAVPHEPWDAAIAQWRTEAPFQTHAMGSWDARALPEGGTSISYTFWADTGVMPASVQSWAMSRTLPEMMRAFEAHVGAIAIGSH